MTSCAAVAPGKQDLVRRGQQQLVSIGRADAGCLQCDPNLAACLAATEGGVVKFSLSGMTKVV